MGSHMWLNAQQPVGYKPFCAGAPPRSPDPRSRCYSRRHPSAFVHLLAHPCVNSPHMITASCPSAPGGRSTRQLVRDNPTTQRPKKASEDPLISAKQSVVRVQHCCSCVYLVLFLIQKANWKLIACTDPSSLYASRACIAASTDAGCAPQASRASSE